MNEREQPAQKLRLGQRIKEARGFTTQAALASRSRVSDRTISTLERGDEEGEGYRPKAETLARLAIALDKDPMEWVKLCDDGGDFNEADIARLRERMRQEQMAASPEDFVPGPLLREEFKRHIEEAKQDLRKLIEQTKGLTMEEQERFRRDLEPADDLRAEFQRDLGQIAARLLRMEGRMDDYRSLMEEMRSRLDLVSTFIQTLNRS